MELLAKEEKNAMARILEEERKRYGLETETTEAEEPELTGDAEAENPEEK